MFEVGKKVVCIDDRFPMVDGEMFTPPMKPKRHETLPVSDIYDHERLGLFLSFDKFNTPENICWWIAKHFRPLESMPDFTEQIEAQQQQETIEILTPEMV